MPVNRLLTDRDREFLKPTINAMWLSCPHMMRRKIERANVQQAFVVYEVLKAINSANDKILSVGCYDDTALEHLKYINVVKDIVGIDPQINYDLTTYALTLVFEPTFDIIFSTSVIEHVQYDEQFIADICQLLKMGGVGILTMDFNDGYKIGDRLPATDLRFYTKKDLEFRLTKILTDNGCDLVDIPDWNGEPEFTHDGCNYSFATFVFRKIKDV